MKTEQDLRQEFVREMVDDVLDLAVDYGYASARGTLTPSIEKVFADLTEKLYRATELIGEQARPAGRRAVRRPSS
jgi:hypothetical protein